MGRDRRKLSSSLRIAIYSRLGTTHDEASEASAYGACPGVERCCALTARVALRTGVRRGLRAGTRPPSMQGSSSRYSRRTTRAHRLTRFLASAFTPQRYTPISCSFRCVERWRRRTHDDQGLPCCQATAGSFAAVASNASSMRASIKASILRPRAALVRLPWAGGAITATIRAVHRFRGPTRRHTRLSVPR